MTYSEVGKKKRLNRLFTRGRALVVPVDDSLIFGPKQGLFELEETIQKILAAEPNALLGYKKDMEIVASHNIDAPFIFNITASTVLNEHTRKVIVASVENAIIAGADSVAAHINFSSRYESEMLRNFAFIANECDKYGMPLLAIAYPRSEKNGKDYNYEDIYEKNKKAYSELVAHCVRIASELGADIIKTHYTGDIELFYNVVRAGCNKPIIVSGGPKMGVAQSFEKIENAMKAGASGISFGRNVFNDKNITAYLMAAKEIIFNSASRQAVLEKYKLSGGI